MVVCVSKVSKLSFLSVYTWQANIWFINVSCFDLKYFRVGNVVKMHRTCLHLYKMSANIWWCITPILGIIKPQEAGAEIDENMFHLFGQDSKCLYDTRLMSQFHDIFETWTTKVYRLVLWLFHIFKLWIRIWGWCTCFLFCRWELEHGGSGGVAPYDVTVHDGGHDDGLRLPLLRPGHLPRPRPRPHHEPVHDGPLLSLRGGQWPDDLLHQQPQHEIRQKTHSQQK